MAISYTTLISSKETEGSIKNLINFSDLPVTSIMENAQALIASFLRSREMRTRATDTFQEDNSTSALPERFQEPISIQLIGNYAGQKLDILPGDDFENCLFYQADTTTLMEGMPTRCTIDATHILLDVTCDANYDYSMWYYGVPAPLSTSNETNFLTDRYPHLLTAAVKHYAFDHRQATDRATAELKKLMGFIEQLNREHDYVKASYSYSHHWGDR